MKKTARNNVSGTTFYNLVFALVCMVYFTALPLSAALSSSDPEKLVNGFDVDSELYSFLQTWKSSSSVIVRSTSTYYIAPSSMKIDYTFNDTVGVFRLTSNTGNWNLSKWENFNFWVKGDSSNDDFVWVGFEDSNGNIIKYGPQSSSDNDDFSLKSDSWQQFTVNFFNDDPVVLPSKQTFDFTNVTKVIIEIANQEAAVHSSTVYFDQFSLSTNKASFVNPTEFSPNNDGVNDITSLFYALPADSYVTLEVLNSGGALVKTLKNDELQSQGKVIVDWDGKDNNGTVVANGTYTFSITTPAVSDSIAITVNNNANPVGNGTWLKAPLIAPQMSPVVLWYNIPANFSTITQTERQTLLNSDFTRISDLGIEVIVVRGNTTALRNDILAAAGTHNLKVILIGSGINVKVNPQNLTDTAPIITEAAVYADLIDFVNEVKNNSALFGYYIIDEPDEKWGKNIQVFKRVLEELDPKHPGFVALNNRWNMSNMVATINPQINLSHCYPLSNQNLLGDFTLYGTSSVGGNIDFSAVLDEHQVASAGKKLWYWIQAHSYSTSLSLPDPEEIRCMTYTAVAHGVSSILFFLYKDAPSLALEGLVDINDNKRDNYFEVQSLTGKLKQILPVIKYTTVVNNLIQLSGGGTPGGGDPANPDIYPYDRGVRQTLQDDTTGELFIAIVNRNVTGTDNMSVTIPGSSLNYAIRQVKDLGTGDIFTPAIVGSNWTLQLNNVPAGDGKFLHLESFGNDYAALIRGNIWDMNESTDATANSHMTPATFANGILSSTITNSTPYIILTENNDIDTTRFTKLTYRMNINAADTNGTWVTWRTGGVYYSSVQRLDVVNGWHTYEIDLSAEANWQGTVDYFRVQAGSGSEMIGKTVDLDWANLYAPLEYAADIRGDAWDMNESADATANSHMTAATFTAGILSSSITNSTPYIILTENNDIDTSRFTKIKYRMNINAADTNGTWVTWRTGGKYYSSIQRLDVVNGWYTYEIDLSTEANWQGTVDYFRVQAGSGSEMIGKTVDLDWVKLEVK
ncbi:MAG: gliding motility-associated C-terminal domain-containing protein [Victivallaceae bacterium]|nr:gliding motility-associated C-terminal domain-containing protein [Victivallaceae bacterium]